MGTYERAHFIREDSAATFARFCESLLLGNYMNEPIGIQHIRILEISMFSQPILIVNIVWLPQR